MKRRNFILEAIGSVAAMLIACETGNTTKACEIQMVPVNAPPTDGTFVLWYPETTSRDKAMEYLVDRDGIVIPRDSEYYTLEYIPHTTDERAILATLKAKSQ